MEKQAKLILMRHGQSEWNRLNLFTGWVDIPLSLQGIQGAIEGGEGKKIAHLPIDVIFVSSLIRAQMRAMLATATSTLEVLLLYCVPLQNRSAMSTKPDFVNTLLVEQGILIVIVIDRFLQQLGKRFRLLLCPRLSWSRCPLFNDKR